MLSLTAHYETCFGNRIPRDAANRLFILIQQNYPNPFNPTTTNNYAVSQKGLVSIAVYNQIGQKVATLVNKAMPAGAYEVSWNASDMPSGIYFYTLQTGEQKVTRKMMLAK